MRRGRTCSTPPAAGRSGTQRPPTENRRAATLPAAGTAIRRARLAVEIQPVVVVGAGSAGLATAAALGRRGIPVLVLESGEGIGTSWRGRHEELRLNTLRWLS